MTLGPSEIARSKVPERTKIAVWAKAAGRCVLCAVSLLEPGMTGSYHSALLVGQIAHNVAASAKGPRGASDLGSDGRADEENLLLLCFHCHQRIDNPTHAGLFTEEYVRAKKHEHQLRVRRVTNFATMQKTLVLNNGGNLRGDTVRITNEEITEALVDANLVAHVHDGWRSDIAITLDGVPATASDWLRGRKAIDEGLDSLARGRSEGGVDHVSVFALTYVPWLVYLGSRLDDTMGVEVFERRRTPGARAWCWEQDAGSEAASFGITTSDGDDCATDALVIVNVTGTVSEQRIPSALAQLPRVVFAPLAATPAPGILRSRADLQTAADSWMKLLGQIEALWPRAQRLHIVGAVPSSFAVRMGMHRMKAAHAAMIVYHRDGDTYQATPPITD